MVLTQSATFTLGTQAPEFCLPDVVGGNEVCLKDIAGHKATVVMFVCNHCPYVRHIIDGIVTLANDYWDHDIGMVAINANDISAYPDDAPDKMQALAENMEFPFPYLYDESQDTARAYHAACTPDFYVFDASRVCVYHGQFDDSRPDNDEPVTGADLRGVLDLLLKGSAVPEAQRPSLGCNIKWKA